MELEKQGAVRPHFQLQFDQTELYGLRLQVLASYQGKTAVHVQFWHCSSEEGASGQGTEINPHPVFLPALQILLILVYYIQFCPCHSFILILQCFYTHDTFEFFLFLYITILIVKDDEPLGSTSPANLEVTCCC